MKIIISIRSILFLGNSDESRAKFTPDLQNNRRLRIGCEPK